MMDCHEQPSDVAAEAGHVVVDGPGSVAVTLSPEAALATAERLEEGAVLAQGQRVLARG